jgi:hypothetical protein
MTKLKWIPLIEAQKFITQFHRHNKKPQTHIFSIGLFSDTGELVGVGICGRPASIGNDDGKTIEISRVCVKDNIPNANSKIYGRLRRICQMMGFERIITYTLTDEAQSSLLAIGAEKEAILKARPGSWNEPGRRRENQVATIKDKIRWSIPCNLKIR